MRVMPALSVPSRSRRRSSVTRSPSRMKMLLLRQRLGAGSSELLMAENRNAFDPSSRFIRMCQQLRLAAILLELVSIPFLAAFHPEATRSQLIGVYVCELLFCADIYVQLNTGYYENGNVLRDARKARRKYLSSPGFLADLLALVPLSLVLPENTTGSRSMALLEMHKLVRMWRLPALTSNLDDLYARHFAALKLTKVLGFTLLLTHFVACGRFSFGYDDPSTGDEPNDWLPHAPHEGHHTTRRQYLMSLFWAFGLLTGGFEGELPRHNAEFAFTIAVGLCGFTLFTSLCATFFLLSKCESGDAELAEARVHQFQHILAFHRVPAQLQAQAVDYLQRYHTQTEANEREAARRLCSSISVDIQVELLEATVALVPVFAGCDSLFIRAVARLLELVALPARVALFRAGDHGDAMYIVHTGVLHTVVGGVKVRELRKGNFVGEVAVFARQPRSATVITATYCTLYRLSRIHADKLLEGYPQYAKVINRTVDEMLQKNSSTDVEEISNIPQEESEAKKNTGLSLVQLVHLKRLVRARALANKVGVSEDPTDSTKADEVVMFKEDKTVEPTIPQPPAYCPPPARKISRVHSENAKSPRHSSPMPPPSQHLHSDTFYSDSRLSARKRSKSASHLLKIFPATCTTQAQPVITSTPSPASPRRASQRLSFLANITRITVLRDNFFHDNTVKPADAIQGFYEQFAHLTTTSSASRQRWWHRVLMRRGLDAETNWRMAWIALVAGVICYNWVLIPLLLAFSMLDELWSSWYIITLNVLADIVLWIDIYCSLHLSFSVNSEKIVEPKRSAERYLSSGRFILDLWCAWPYWIFSPSKFTYPALRIPKLIGGYRLPGLVREVEAYFRLNSKHKLMLLGVLFLMLYHIVACLYFSTTYLDGYSTGDDKWLPSDDVYLRRINATHFETISGIILDADSTKVQEMRAEQYFRSLYYAANVLAAVGRTIEPASDTEYGAALVFMLSGFFITAIVVDHVQKGFTASALEQKEFFAARARFQRFLKRQNAPLPIHQRVNSFLDFWWSAHRGAIIDELLEDLPAAIKRDVIRSICTPAMDSLELLCTTATTSTTPKREEELEPSVTTILEQVEEIFLDNLKFVLYGQGEIIYRRGDYASGLFFLLEGKVSVVLDGGVARHVPLGGFFGTAALQSTRNSRDRRESKRRSTVMPSVNIGYTERVTAVSGCIVVYVSREHLRAMQNIFPTLPECLQKLEHRLHDTRVVRSADLRSLQPRVGLGAIGLNNPTMRLALRRKQVTGLVQLLAKNLEWWQRGVAVNPDWPFVGMWEATMLLTSTVQGALVMFYVCFGANDSSGGRTFADAIMVAFELLFVLDVYLHFRLGFYEYGNKIMDLAVIQRRYVRSVRFAIDIAALVPFYIVNWMFPTRNLEILNVNKMLRYFKGSSQFQTLETKYVKLTMELRLLKLVYYSFLASHMFGCVWFDFAAHKSGVHIVLSGPTDTSTPSFGVGEWGPYESLESAARGLQYLASIFWSYGLMSNSSPGELPKTVGECIFSVFTMTVGFFLFAYVVGHISDVIELQDSENRHFVAKLSSLRQLLRHFDLPPSVEEKFKKYFFFKRFHSITQEHVLERVLPPSLVVDMRMFQLQPMIVKVAFLVGMEDSVTRMLVSLFTQVLFVKDEFICHFGEEGSEMFFIYTGVLDIYIPFLTPTTPSSPGGSVAFPTTSAGTRVSLSGLRKVNEITAGSYFGEAALFTNTPRNAFVKANTSCILYKLSRHSLELVFVRYPEWQQKVLRIVKIQQQQQRLQRLAYEAQAPDTGGGGRRRGLQHRGSRIDFVNARAENIEQVLLSHRRGSQLSENAPRRLLIRRLKSWVIQQWKNHRAVVAMVRWMTPIWISLQAIGNQIAHGAEIQSAFYLQWMRLVSICTVYVAVMVPYRLTYDSLDRWNLIPVCLRVFEALCEVVFWLDIWFQFHMRKNQAAMELYEQDQLVGYKRERLALDLAATFPLDHFVASFSNGWDQLLLNKWLRLNRCLKVANLVYYRNEITRRSVSFEVNRAQTLWLLYLLAMFWTSCAYFAVSIYDGFGTEWQNWLPSVILDSDDPSSSLVMLRLFRGLAFAVTAFVKKSRTFVPASQLNFAFTLVISFIGQLIMALMIAEMANVFLLYIDNEVQFRKHHLIVERSLARWKVSTALKRRADNFLTSWWSSHAGVDYQLIFEDLPASVRTEGIMAIAKQPLSLFVHRVFRPLLRDQGGAGAGAEGDGESKEIPEQVYGDPFHLGNLTYAIAKCLRFEGYPRGEGIIVEGSVCKAMYFVVRGYLLSKSLSNSEMYPASRYRGGDYFGECGLLGHSVSLMTVTTIRACDLFVLNSDHLRQVLQSHPYFSLILATAQLAASQNKKKTTAQFVAEWFRSNDEMEDIESSGNSEDDSDADDDDSEDEDEGEKDQVSAMASQNDSSMSEDVRLRRGSQLLKRELRGASRETMDTWAESFELFMEMLVPKGSMGPTEVAKAAAVRRKSSLRS